MKLLCVCGPTASLSAFLGFRVDKPEVTPKADPRPRQVGFHIAEGNRSVQDDNRDMAGLGSLLSQVLKRDLGHPALELNLD